MIESFFVWLLGPTLAFVSFIVFIILVLFGVAGMIIHAEDILRWWEKHNANE